MVTSNSIINRILNRIQNDRFSCNLEEPSSRDIIGYGHKWVKDKETGEEKRVTFPIYPKTKPVVKIEDAVNVASAPWSTREEKIQHLRDLGATDSMINMAFRKSFDQAHRRRVHGRLR